MTRFASELKGSAAGLAFRRSARPISPPPPGARAVFFGDSITNGSSAANGQRWVDQVPKILGSAISPNSVVRGWPGQRADQIAGRYDQDVRGNGAQVLFVLAGTNDASQGRTLAQFAASIRQIVAKAQQDGIPVILGTVPPRGSSASASIHLLVQQYNAWIKAWAPANGVKVADVFKNVASSTGYLLPSGYDSGDGVHPETAGHEFIAEAFATAFLNLNAISPTPHIADTIGPFNLITNPQFLSGTTGWFEFGTATGTAPTYSAVADASGALSYGQWGQMAFTATAGGTRTWGTSTSAVTAGSKILVAARVAMTDIAGGYRAAAVGSNPSATFGVRVYSAQSGILLANYGSFTPMVPGPVLRIVTVPAGTTSLVIGATVTLPTGQNATFRIGEVGAYDVTQLPDLALAAAP